MLKFESKQDTDLETQLRKAQNRERVAQCKLDRLKERFERLQIEMEQGEAALKASRGEGVRLREQLVAARTEKEHLEQESAMWRAQLFERMEMLDKTKAALEETRRQLKEAEAKAARAAQTHRASHEELKRRDREKQAYQAEIEELRAAHQNSREQGEELLAALTDAEQAIQSLQRSNDFHQREIAGLRSIGAGLTESLSKMTQQRDRYKERLEASQAELRLERAESAHLLSEVERLKDELYETRGRLMTFQIEADVREIRKAGVEKSARAAGEKFNELPPEESRPPEPPGGSFLRRASKRVSGWFRLGDGPSRN